MDAPETESSTLSPHQTQRHYGSILPHASASNIGGETVAAARDSANNTRRWLTLILPAWIRYYQRDWLKADFLGALTVASLYIPLSFSFAAIGHVSKASSLYAFVFHPPIYALFGSCSLMVVGPEATGSLLVGAAMRSFQSGEGDSIDRAVVSGTATALAGLMLVAAKLGGLSFLDNILSRPLMKGFICGIGLVLIVDQTVPALGLEQQFIGSGENGALFKAIDLLGLIFHAHLPSAVMSICSLAFILVCGSLKTRGPKTSWVTLFPDRLVVIVITALFAYVLHLDRHGLAIVGPVGSGGLTLPTVVWPFKSISMLREIASTSLMMALLGYFESSVTAKSLKAAPGVPSSVSKNPDPDSELVALGLANILGGCFATLPAFGGFGRSKLNAQAGSLTPMSSIFLSAISLACALFVTRWLYYVPKPTLAAMSCAVGISMIQECAHDVGFFFRMRAWPELAQMTAVAAVIFAHSMSLGVVVGLGWTILSIVRAATIARFHSSSIHLPTSCGVALEGSWYRHSAANDSIVSFRLTEDLSFTNSAELVRRIRQATIAGGEGPMVRHLILDFQHGAQVDACSVRDLRDIVSTLVADGISVTACVSASGATRQRLEAGGIVDICDTATTDCSDVVEASIKSTSQRL